MSNIRTMAAHLAELESVRKNLLGYSHADDLGPIFASALRYVGGTVQKEAVTAQLVMALDDAIRLQKNAIRDALFE